MCAFTATFVVCVKVDAPLPCSTRFLSAASLVRWRLCRADSIIASRHTDSAGSGSRVCPEAVWRAEYRGVLLRRGSGERRGLSCGLGDGGDAGRPRTLHLPKQWLRNQARLPPIPLQAQETVVIFASSCTVVAQHRRNASPPGRMTDAYFQNAHIKCASLLFVKGFICWLTGILPGQRTRLVSAVHHYNHCNDYRGCTGLRETYLRLEKLGLESGQTSMSLLHESVYIAQYRKKQLVVKSDSLGLSRGALKQRYPLY